MKRHFKYSQTRRHFVTKIGSFYYFFMFLKFKHDTIYTDKYLENFAQLRILQLLTQVSLSL